MARGPIELAMRRALVTEAADPGSSWKRPVSTPCARGE